MEAKEIHLKEGIAIIHPCTADRSRVSGEFKVFEDCEDYFKIGEVQKALESCPSFKNVKASESLGIAKAKYDRSSVTIFTDGRINVFKANNETELIVIVEKVLKTIHGCATCMYKICGGKA